MQAPETVPLGDIIQGTSASIFLSLSQLLGNFKSLTPEIRTIRLQAFVSKSKKKLAQLLALCKWFGSPDVTKFFLNLTHLSEHLQGLEIRLNEIQDGLYFTHRDLFVKRLRSINVQASKEILATSCYPNLPKAIFTCGRLPSPDNDAGNTSAAQIRSDLSLYIKAKLKLHEGNIKRLRELQYTIRDGLLTVELPYVYSVTLSLQYLSDEAPWQILGYTIRARNNASVSLANEETEFDTRIAEQGLLSILQNESQLESTVENICSVASRVHDQKVAADSAKADVVDPLKVGNGAETTAPAPSVPVESTAMNTEAPDASASQTNPRSPSSTLSLLRIHSLCLHTGEAAVVRILYVQSVELAKSQLFGGKLEVGFQELPDVHRYAVKFWRSAFTRTYQYELRVEHTRNVEVLNNENDFEKEEAELLKLTVSLISTQKAGESDRESGPKDVEKRDKSRTGAAADYAHRAIKNAYYYVKGGVDSRRLINDAFSACSTLKLQITFAKILLSLRFLPHSQLSVTYDAVDISISMNGHKAKLESDLTTGRICVDVRSAGVLDSVLERRKEVFVSEINNQMMDELVSSYLNGGSVVEEVKRVIERYAAKPQGGSYVSNRLDASVSDSTAPQITCKHLRALDTFDTILHILHCVDISQTMNESLRSAGCADTAKMLMDQINGQEIDSNMKMNGSKLASSHSTSTRQGDSGIAPLTGEFSMAWKVAEWDTWPDTKRNQISVDSTQECDYLQLFPYSLVPAVSLAALENRVLFFSGDTVVTEGDVKAIAGVTRTSGSIAPLNNQVEDKKSHDTMGGGIIRIKRCDPNTSSEGDKNGLKDEKETSRSKCSLYLILSVGQNLHVQARAAIVGKLEQNTNGSHPGLRLLVSSGSLIDQSVGSETPWQSLDFVKVAFAWKRKVVTCDVNPGIVLANLCKGDAELSKGATYMMWTSKVTCTVLKAVDSQFEMGLLVMSTKAEGGTQKRSGIQKVDAEELKGIESNSICFGRIRMHFVPVAMKSGTVREIKYAVKGIQVSAETTNDMAITREVFQTVTHEVLCTLFLGKVYEKSTMLDDIFDKWVELRPLLDFLYLACKQADETLSARNEWLQQRGVRSASPTDATSSVDPGGAQVMGGAPRGKRIKIEGLMPQTSAESHDSTVEGENDAADSYAGSGNRKRSRSDEREDMDKFLCLRFVHMDAFDATKTPALIFSLGTIDSTGDEDISAYVRVTSEDAGKVSLLGGISLLRSESDVVECSQIKPEIALNTADDSEKREENRAKRRLNIIMRDADPAQTGWLERLDADVIHSTQILQTSLTRAVRALRLARSLG